MWLYICAVAALIWYTAVILVSGLGLWQLYLNISQPHAQSVSAAQSDHAPHLTIIRPAKGIEPFLYECLSSSFHLAYPHERLTIALCVASAQDPALSILKKVVAEHPDVDGRIYIEGRDGTAARALGPNPKIRNMSQAYHEAPGDLVWILDCNVWVHADTAGRLVDRLCGLGADRRKYKFVHHLPLALDASHLPLESHSTTPRDSTTGLAAYVPTGGMLEELFLSTAHAKFYTAIATAAIAPCTNGKSTLFRRSHLNALTIPTPEHAARGRRPGIDCFSDNICEDHLISDLLWRSPVPATAMATSSERWGNHALVAAPPCVQPVHQVALRTYAARRARWLRVRKFTVPAATAVEPGTEALLANTIGAAGLAALLPPEVRVWAGVFALVGVVAWAAVDYGLWRLLQWRVRENAGAEEPEFLRQAGRRSGAEWLRAWVEREVLAFPIWAWAIFGGSGVVWRGRRFVVGMDAKVREVEDVKKAD